MARKERIILILDEFPYLCSSQPALPSILQRIWDEIGKDSRLYLILCGSFVSFMEREILPYLDNFIGQGFDKICCEILRYLVARGRIKMDYDRAGRWWNGNEEIDLVGIAGDTPVFAAECKWSKKAARIDVLKDLQRKVSLLAPAGKTASIRLGFRGCNDIDAAEEKH